MVNTNNLSQTSDELVRAAKRMAPEMELHELGGWFLSIGCFLSSNAIPDLWPQLRSAALISQDLLNQEKTGDKHVSG